MTKRDYYEILSVSKSASAEEIKASYRKLAMKHHPDKNQGNSESEEKFKELAEAYEILSDPNKRQRYDQFGHQGVNGGGQGFSDINDIFSQFGDIFGNFSRGGNSSGGSIFDDFFGGGGGQRSSRREQSNQGSDLRINLKLTLEEIAEGVEKTLKVKKYKTCSKCEGNGAKSGSGHSKCTHCHGTGEIRQATRSIFGQFINVTMCNYCNGEGRIIKEKCDECHGDGRVKTETTIKVTVPHGVAEGNYIPLRGQGNAGVRGGSAGNLLVFIEEEEHKDFIRDEDDIYYDLEVSLVDAIMGAEVVVPTLSGKAKLTIETGTESGKLLRMKDKGIKHLNEHGRGDQIVRVNIHIPKKINAKEKELLKELSKSENFKPKHTHSATKDKKQEKGFFKNVFS
ncbi:MAG TPA: molecular chaperone DnaJ [Ignavibacteria bacterium]|nr:molecular chaperone DnaJ [Ignavibacteria bacterium]